MKKMERNEENPKKSWQKFISTRITKKADFDEIFYCSNNKNGHKTFLVNSFTNNR
jgi:hypothetical protein